MNKWDRKEYDLTLELYSKLKKENKAMHISTPEVIALAEKTGRSCNSIAMRLQNFEYYATGGEKGLSNGSKMCKIVYDENWRKLGLAAPPESPVSSDHFRKSSMVTQDTGNNIPSMNVINQIVVSVALCVNNIDMIKSDTVDLFASLTTLCRFINTESFSISDLKSLSSAVKSIPDYPNDILDFSLKSVLSESQYLKLKTLIKIFK